MTTGGPSHNVTRPLLTLVLRLWEAGSSNQRQALHLEATHVQTGEVAYFRTFEGVVQHIERLAQQLTARATGQPPINLSHVRRRGKDA
jgi:hypothetical protein